MSKSQKKVLVFGVFDGCHAGHCAFLEQAANHGEHLVAVITRDFIVQILKGFLPHFNEEERRDTLIANNAAHEVIFGDSEHGSWQVLFDHQPDIVVVGYDQGNLVEALQDFFVENGLNCEIVVAEAHEPETYSSGKLLPQRK